MHELTNPDHHCIALNLKVKIDNVSSFIKKFNKSTKYPLMNHANVSLIIIMIINTQLIIQTYSIRIKLFVVHLRLPLNKYNYTIHIHQ